MNDDELLAALGAAMREAEEVPDEFVVAAKAAYAWRDLDAQLAALVADSARDPEPVGMRDTAPTSRWLTFRAGALSLEVELRGSELHAQLVPPEPGTARLESEGSGDGLGRVVPVDEVGYLVLRDLPDGRRRLHVRTASGAALVTDWF